MKRILRVFVLLTLIAIPSLVRAAISVSFTTSSNRTGCNAVFASFTPTTVGCAGAVSYTWYYIKTPATSAADTVTSSSSNRSFTSIGCYNVAVRAVCGTDTAYAVQPNYICVTNSPVINFTAGSVPSDTLLTCARVINFVNTSNADTACPTHSWRWVVNGPATFADVFATNASFNFTTPGDYTVTLIYSSGCTCFGSMSRVSYIHIAPPPVVCFTRTDTTLGCHAPVTATFSSACSTGASSYTWTFTGGTPSTITTTGTTVSSTFNSPGNFNVSVTATSSVGCTTSSTAPIAVHVGNFTANFKPLAADTVCEGSVMILRDSTYVDAIAPVSNVFNIAYASTPGTILSSTSMATSPIDLNFGFGYFRIVDIVTNGNGCVDSMVRFVYVRPKPVVTLTADTLYKCSAPLVEHFHATPVNAAYTYRWTYAPLGTATFLGTGASGANPTFTYTAGGVYNPKVLVTDQFGCKDSATNVGYIRIQPPTVTIQNITDSGCTPINVCYHIDITPVGTPFSVDTFYFGDGTRSLAGNYTDTCHLYTAGGTYTSKVVWHLPAYLGGCTGSDTSFVVIGTTHPIAHMGLSPNDSVCPNTVVYFTDTCVGCFTHWHIGNNGFAGDAFNTDTTSMYFPNPSNVSSQPGGYPMYVSNCLNGCCDTLRDTIFVYPPPIQSNSLRATTANCNRRDSVTFRCLGATGATSYQWNYGDGSSLVTTTGLTSNHIYTAPYSPGHTYTVVVAAQSGPYPTVGMCNNTDTLILYVGPPNKTWNIVDSNVCVGQMAYYHGPRQTDSTAYPSYRWLWGDGSSPTTVANDSTATHIYNHAGTFRDTVIFQNNYGCYDTGIVKRTHVFGPSGGFSAVPTTVCAGTAVNFTDNNTFPGTSIFKRMVSFDYPTSPVTSAALSPATFSHTFVEGSYLVVLSDTDNSPKHCASFDSIRINSVKPHAYFTSVDTLGACAGVTVAFHDTNTHCTYSWNFGDGGGYTTPSAADSNITHVYTSNGNYTVSVIVTSDGTGGYPLGCSDVMTRNNYIHLSSSSGIGIVNYGDSSVGCPPLQLAVGPTSTSNSYLYTYAWHVYNPGIATYNSTYLFTNLTSTGTHTVTMVAISPRGCVDSSSRSYFVGGPTGTITATPTSGCAPYNVVLHFENTGSVSLGSNYIWNTCPFGSFSTTTPDVTLTYTTPGVYCPPSVVIQDGSCAVTVDNLTDSIRVYTPANVTVTHAPRICYGATDTLRATGAVNYSWYGPSGNLCPAGSCTFITVSPLVTTVYTVIGSNVYNCTDTQYVTVHVDSPIVINIVGLDSVCIGQQDILTASGGSGVFNWVTHPGSNDTSGLSCAVCNPVIVRTTTTRVYWAITTNALGCKDSASFKVTVNPLPLLHVTPDPAHVCEGDSTKLTATGATKYLWKPRIGLSCDSCSSPWSSITSNLIYSLTGTTQFGCKDSIAVPVEVYHHNVISKKADTTICAGDQAHLTARGGLSYVWRPAATLNNAFIYNPIASPTVTTIYTVYITENPCFNDSLNVKVTVIPLPILSVPPTTTIIAGNSVQLYADSLNHVFLTNYSWTPADSTLTCSDCSSPIATPVVTTTYSVTASTIEGCAGHATVTVKLLCDDSKQVFIPNTFTPNGDGNNDRFFVSGKGLGLIKRMAIYNRWGELVYEAYNVHANDPSVGWDGTFRGEVVAPDVFVYVLDVECSTGSSFVFRGDISLVR